MYNKDTVKERKVVIIMMTKAIKSGKEHRKEY